MALDDILRAIRAETDAEIRRLDDACAAEVAEIEARAAVDARRVEREASDALDHTSDRQAARIVDRARLDARRSSLAAVESAYQESLALLRARLKELRKGDAYPGIFSALLEEGLEVIGEPIRLIVDPADVELARRVLAQHGAPDIGVDPTGACSGGLELASGDGRLVRNTFESRLERAEGRLRSLVARQLPDGETT